MHRTRTLVAAGGALALVLVSAGSARAADQYWVRMEQLNDSGASGTALVTVDGNYLTVTVSGTGFVPSAPHAQHLHGGTDLSKDFMCPGPERDADGSGIITTTEAIPDYGDIFVSLTTSGDTSEDSDLAVDRMPVADAEGRLEYERTFAVGDDVVAAIRNLHLVQHGLDTNGNSEYDASAGPSDLDAALPEEATAPVTCGMIEGSTVRTVPSGGVPTGGTDTARVEQPALLSGGVGALVTAVLLALSVRRRRRAAATGGRE